MTQAFNLSQFANKVNTSGQADLTTAVTGTLPQANGGTGTTTAANGELLIGNGSGFTKATLTQGSGVTITNASGAITIAAASSANIQTQLFTAPGTWTKPSTATQVRVTVVGGGAGSGQNNAGNGGLACAIVPVSNPVAVTVGAGGNRPNGVGGSSSFGALVSATGGAIPSGPTVAGNPGTGTVSTGTSIKASYQTGNFLALSGLSTRPQPSGNPGVAYSASSGFMAGAGGQGSAPIGSGGVGGAVLVEFVG